MQKVTYDDIRETSDVFQITVNEEKQITGLQNKKDPHEMNWVRGEMNVWGTVKCDKDLSLSVSRAFTEYGTLVENYTFYNDTGFDIYTLGTDLGICTPFPDCYADAEVCLTNRCHAHIWCGGSSSYVMALRMGGEAPNLGLILREGNLQGYSIERMASTDGREECLSDHRGDVILHPENLHLCPGESYVISWELCWFKDKEDFEQILKTKQGFVFVQSEAFVVTEKERISFTLSVPESADDLVVKREGKEIPVISENGNILVSEIPERTGEYHYQIYLGEKVSRVSFLVLPELEKLAEARVHFIAEHQQCLDERSFLNGAYLIYDNEEQHQYYGHRNDTNGGRERVGMGVLLAHYLQKYPDEKLRESLDRYIAYVLRELYDEETGEVFNDAPRCNDYFRLYNAPFFMRLFMEMYHLTEEEIYLDRFMKCLEYFYRCGGGRFYAICIPMYESVKVFQQAGRMDDAQRLLELYKDHGDFIVECGRNYPAHEVTYEQSIVAPAAIYMGELYHLIGEEKYKQEAQSQYALLDLFEGNQPDYHMNETAIRHWDGYWFGKYRCLGDTFPHYWSALSGYAFLHTEQIADTDKYAKKARKSLRGVLSMFREDGSASCAMVYPMSVNGKKASFYDPWANDQDWGLYFNLKYGSEV